MTIDVLERPEAASRSGLAFHPATPVIGAEVTGIDLRQKLDDATVAKLRKKLNKYKVLFFRDQPISDLDQIRFSKYFGAITPAHPVTNGLPEQPEIKRNVKSLSQTRKSVFDDVQQQLLRAQTRSHRSRGWHTDITFVANPNDFTFLRGLEVQAFGGDTLFVNLEALYESLSPSIKTLVDGLQAVHARYDALRGFPPEPRFDGRSTGPFLAQHPLVRVHPETGKKSLFLSPGFLKYIVGLSDGESRALIDYLIEELSGRQDLQVRFRWSPNSLVVWDNRATSHFGPVDGAHFDGERVVHRTTVGASFPVGPDGYKSKQITGELFYTLD